MKQEAASINGLEVGTVRIGAPASVCIQWLPALMRYFKKRVSSDRNSNFFQAGYQDIEEWITNGVIDFGFIALPTLESFETIPLKKDRILCILPHNHPLSNQDKNPYGAIRERKLYYTQIRL
ncbi:hypothetical protein GCM10020331_054450 [Ectobacillus funiculus]